MSLSSQVSELKLIASWSVRILRARKAVRLLRI